jgi:predicted enzyme related to lactoylglutathione lyase
MIVGVQDVHYYVADMPRAIAFYSSVLGMQVLDSNEWWTSLECFGARIGLHWTGGGPPPSAVAERGAQYGATLTLRSTDLDADLAYLTRCGVRVLDRSEHPWGRLAAICDPDGNVLKLMQPPARP